MGEKTDIETIAVAIYESYVRALADEPRKRAPDWYSVGTTIRQEWRERAREMVRDFR